MSSLFIMILIAFLLSGCFGQDKMQAINTLRDLAKERSEQEAIIKSERKRFRLLLKDIKDMRLKKGLSANKVCRLYGDPISIKYLDSEEENRILVFSEPMSYFKEVKAYLYFDEYNKLSSWEVK